MRWLFGLIAAAPLAVVGCGGGSSTTVTAAGTTAGPHGGLAIPLPDGKGFAEVVVEKDPKAKPGSKSAMPKIAVYFLGPDVKTPLTPAPTTVSVKSIPPTGESATVSLTLDGTRFITPPGDFDYDELRGELTATFDGQSATVPFAFR